MTNAANTETRQDLLNTIRNARLALASELPESRREYLEAQRDEAITKLDAILLAEGPAN